MNLPALSIKNPVFAVMVSAAMIFFGYLGYREMGVSQFPEIDFPVVSVAVTLEQASPEVMDGDVTDIIEDAVSGVEGVDYITSQSYQGVSIVNVYFRLDRKIDVAMQDVQNAVAAIRRRLPREIDPPVITKVNPNNLPVMWLTLSSANVPPNRISDYAERELKPQLTSLPDVGGIQFSGLRPRNLRIWLDSKKLETYNLDPADIRQAITAQHIELPAGYINSAQVELNVRTMGEFGSASEFEKLLIKNINGQNIYLGDIAKVEDGSEDIRTIARFNRLPAVAVGVRKAIGGNLVAVCEHVKNELPKIRRTLPEGVELNISVDSSTYVRENIAEMKLTLILGVILTAIVCFVFLGSMGLTVNICLSIPTSLIGTFFIVNYGMELLRLPPFTINLMTLLALSLSVGVVVDDAILVLENIARHREMGKSKVEAALEGSSEISFAAIAATFSIMAIFLPVAFMSGTIGRFFFQFGVTVGVAVFLSLICALTLTPMLCATVLGIDPHKKAKILPNTWQLAGFGSVFVIACGTALRLAGDSFPILQGYGWYLNMCEVPVVRKPLWWGGHLLLEAVVGLLLFKYGTFLYQHLERWVLRPVFVVPVDLLMKFLTRIYALSLAFALKVRWLVVLLGMTLIGLTGWFLMSGVIGKELIPSEDQSRFVIHVVCPVNSNVAQVDRLLQACEIALVDRPDVATVLTTVGGETGQVVTEADLYIGLVPREQRKLTQSEIMAEVRKELEQVVPDVKIVIRDQSLEGFTAQRGDPIDFVLRGKWEDLPEIAAEIMEKMQQSGLMQDVDSDYRPGKTEEQVIPTDKANLLGVSTQRMAEGVSSLVGGQRVAKFTDRGRRYDVRLRLVENQRSAPGDLDDVRVRVGADKLIPLSELTTRVTVSTLPVVNRFKHQRAIRITANPAEGVSQGQAIAKAQEIVNTVLESRQQVGQDFEMVELGNAEAMRSTINSLIFALVMGIVIAYGILGIQFASFVHPFTVLLALPFAVTGALVTLWLTGDTLNMMSLIGLILLMGLVKKNSIILVDYANQLRKEGKSVYEAVKESGPVRLRPILMTSAATIMAAVPAAVGLGPGAETRSPMARAIIGGILVSTLITLYLVPVFYLLTEQIRGVMQKLVVKPEEQAKSS
ncbi:MAG: efflux RND transporter permease subunit [Gemmataceae bacterium]|jgi:HAE1 family hydrophobic/amphiphilic exporter-1|nr:efflux RND transporter permease subunit [Gemmataceae bacterium]